MVDREGLSERRMFEQRSGGENMSSTKNRMEVIADAKALRGGVPERGRLQCGYRRRGGGCQAHRTPAPGTELGFHPECDGG